MDVRRAVSGRALALLIFLLAAATAMLVYRGDRTAPAPQTMPNEAFRSAPSPEAPAVVWAVGDGADGSDKARRVADLVIADRPERLLYLGDVYPDGSRADFRDNFESVYGRLARITAPTPGNHDWPAHRGGYDPYWRSVTGAATPPWYSLRTGGWRIISLNSEAPHDPGSAQVRWLRGQLDGDAGTCTLAFWHRPLLSAGEHGDQADVAPLWDALRGHARLVLSGHDHDLQRLQARDGITALVAGAGGKSRYDVDSSDPRLAFAADQRDGALRMELRPGAARLDFVSSDGELLDRSTVGCRPAAR